MKTAQSSVEFILVISIVILGFSLFLVLFNMRVDTVQNERTMNLLEDISTVIKSELELASSVRPGYIREFELPAKLSGLEYNISYKNGSVLSSNYSIFVVSYINEEISKNDLIFFTPPNITGNLSIGDKNIITKVGSTICLNGC